MIQNTQVFLNCQQEFKVIGLMSGTSLDGLDIAYCIFKQNQGKWQYRIQYSETGTYPINIESQLKNAHDLQAQQFCLLDIQYGLFIGEQVQQFIDKYKIQKQVDFISSHGHTIFHDPSQKLTVQIGNGAAIASVLDGIPVISDFRKLDVLLGGQGAPLVPIGDKLLFSDYDFCINFGGIANISFDYQDKRIAFDICPCNFVLNSLSKQYNSKFEYDDQGNIAAQGQIQQKLLDELIQLPYFSNKYPKSLAREWITTQFVPILEKYINISIQDKLRTVVELIAIQISNVILQYIKDEQQQIKIKQQKLSILATGGGAFNTFLQKVIQEKVSSCLIIIPDEQIVKFKEALIFAFLGVLRNLKMNNCLQSVTGARIDNSGGCIYNEQKI